MGWTGTGAFGLKPPAVEDDGRSSWLSSHSHAAIWMWPHEMPQARLPEETLSSAQPTHNTVRKKKKKISCYLSHCAVGLFSYLTHWNSRKAVIVPIIQVFGMLIKLCLLFIKRSQISSLSQNTGSTCSLWYGCYSGSDQYLVQLAMPVCQLFKRFLFLIFREHVRSLAILVARSKPINSCLLLIEVGDSQMPRQIGKGTREPLTCPGHYAQGACLNTPTVKNSFP